MSTIDLAADSVAVQAELPGFSGSYPPQDVRFLLQKQQIDPTPVAEKERLIQSGQKHYSQMISAEQAPSARHLAAFDRAMQLGGRRMAAEVQSLALTLAATFSQTTQPVVLVSLVRAGVPLGVALQHALADLGRDSRHYGISIIRDRGIDQAALADIVSWHGTEQLIFVDGWTGKGAISQELERSLVQDRRFIRFNNRLPLVTLADAGGFAWLAASGEDWLIPSGIMGATISGLLSRSILPEGHQQGWHVCIDYPELAAFDQSAAFIRQLDQWRREPELLQAARPASWPDSARHAQQQYARQTIDALAAQYGIVNRNRIKPGIAEATRAVMRRAPDQVLLRDINDPDTRLLHELAEQAGATVVEAGTALGPYRAVTLIQKLGPG